jgi:arylsulfatase A-like enzyme
VQDVVQSRNGNYFRIQFIETEFPSRARGDEDLYDLQNDPHELHNLADQPGQAERLARMRAAVLDWWRNSGGGRIPGLAENASR